MDNNAPKSAGLTEGPHSPAPEVTEGSPTGASNHVASCLKFLLEAAGYPKHAEDWT